MEYYLLNDNNNDNNDDDNNNNNPDNIAEAAHQRDGSGSCGHPRHSRQWTGGESANWRCSGPAPAEPSLPPPCQHRAGSGLAPAPDSAGASRIDT